MAIQYLKKSPKTSSTDDTKTREIVENILKDIEQSKEEGCKEYSKKLDKYEGDVVVSKEKIEEIKKNTRRFAKRQVTWNKKDTSINWFQFEENVMNIISKIDSLIT